MILAAFLLRKGNTNVPNGRAEDGEAECRRYDDIISAHGGPSLFNVKILFQKGLILLKDNSVFNDHSSFLSSRSFRGSWRARPRLTIEKEKLQEIFSSMEDWQDQQDMSHVAGINMEGPLDQLRNAVIVLRCRADQAGGTVPQTRSTVMISPAR